MNITAPAYSAFELTVLRGGFVFVLLLELESLQATPPPAGTHPVGIARLFALDWLGHRIVRRLLPRAVWLAAIALLLDFGTPWALLFLAGAVVLLTTADCSDGVVGHAHHLVAAITVAQLAAVLTWNLVTAVDGSADHAFLLASRDATAAWWSVQTILAVYLTSGLAKLLHTGGSWVQRSPGLLVRARSVTIQMRMLGSARALAVADRSDRLADRVLGHDGVARIAFATGLLVELAAPVGVLRPELLAVVGLALIALHLANGVLLGLAFARWQLLVLVFCVNPAQLFG